MVSSTLTILRVCYLPQTYGAEMSIQIRNEKIADDTHLVDPWWDVLHKSSMFLVHILIEMSTSTVVYFDCME